MLVSDKKFRVQPLGCAVANEQAKSLDSKLLGATQNALAGKEWELGLIVR